MGLFLLKRPCFLYTTDLDEYLETQGFYVDVRDWPFPLAKDNAALVDNIAHFDEEQYLKDVHKHHTDLGSFDNGNATETISNAFCRNARNEDNYESWNYQY